MIVMNLSLKKKLKVVFWSLLFLGCSENSFILCDTTGRRNSNERLEQMAPVPTGSCAFSNGHHYSPNTGGSRYSNGNAFKVNQNHQMPATPPPPRPTPRR
jgi:hypothetical protein